MPAPDDTFAKWLSMAIELSHCCPKSDRSFAVGAVVVDAGDRLLTTGYSLEFGPGWHAEEIALSKAAADGLDLHGCTLFSSLEPCSVRLSGKRPCTEHLLAASIRRVVFALAEPPFFVRCEGRAVLEAGGVEVVHLPEFGEAVRAINAHLFEAHGEWLNFGERGV
ncbi:MAG: dCMP deaminase [Planctomycetes bacterium]|nr:dCMP deaminase [Planctomycetota bacterium]